MILEFLLHALCVQQEFSMLVVGCNHNIFQPWVSASHFPAYSSPVIVCLGSWRIFALMHCDSDFRNTFKRTTMQISGSLSLCNSHLFWFSAKLQLVQASNSDLYSQLRGITHWEVAGISLLRTMVLKLLVGRNPRWFWISPCFLVSHGSENQLFQIFCLV